MAPPVQRPDREHAAVGERLDRVDVEGVVEGAVRRLTGILAPMALEPSTAELTVTDARSPIHSWLMDMDGVLVHEEDLIPGADRFVAILRERELPFLVLTNNSLYTRRDLAARLRKSGIEVPSRRSSPRPWPRRGSWPTSAPAARPSSSARLA